MTTLNTIIEEEVANFVGEFEFIFTPIYKLAPADTEVFKENSSEWMKNKLAFVLTTAMQRAYEAGYKLAVEHLKEVYALNAPTTLPEAIEWLEDNSKYQDKK